jgi:hypothetical protein
MGTKARRDANEHGWWWVDDDHESKRLAKRALRRTQRRHIASQLD